MKRVWRALTLAALVAGLVLSPYAANALKLAQFAAEGAYAEVHLASIPPERYAEEIGAALDASDTVLARSLVSLAASRNVEIPADLTARLAALPGFDMAAALGEGWNCVVNGDFDSEAGFACVVATDMTGVGDVRDLVGEGGKFIAGQPLDYFTLGIASVGLALTVATIPSGGATMPVRVGASFVKAMHRVGKLPPRLTAQVTGALAKGINGPAVREAVDLAASMRLGELGRPLSRLFNPQSVRLVTNLADDFGAIGKAGGVRAMKAGMSVADSAGDVSRVARAATRYGDGFVGVMKLVGRGVLALGDLFLTIAGWLLAVTLWAWGMLRATLNGAVGVDRFFRRRRQARRAAKPAATAAA